MFRTYEFSNIVYFIMMTVNGFVLSRLYKAMFSKERERRPDEIDEESEHFKEYKNPGSGVIQMKFLGRFTIARDSNEISNIANADQRTLIEEFFDNVDKLSKIAAKNMFLFIALIFVYIIINVFHLINIFYLGTKPLTYVYVVWVQHLLLAIFWIFVTLAFKKFNLYIEKVRNVIKAFQSEKKVGIILHEKGNKIDFNFKGN